MFGKEPLLKLDHLVLFVRSQARTGRLPPVASLLKLLRLTGKGK